MYKKFMNLSIKNKLITVFSVILVIFLGVAGAQLYTAQMCMENFTSAHKEYAAPAQDVAKAYAYLNKATALVEEVHMLGEHGDTAEVVEAAKRAEESLEQAKGLAAEVGAAIKDEKVVALFNTAKKDFDAYAALVEGIIKPVIAGQADGGIEVDIADLDAAMAITEKSMLDLDNALLTGSDASQTYIIASQNKTMLILLVIIIVMVIFGVVTATTIVRTIRIPLQEIEAVADKLAIGDINVEVKKHYEDEIGSLADSMVAMVANIKKQTEAAQQMAVGNLTYEMVPASDKDVLGHALKKIFDDNNHALINMKEAASQVSSGSEQVAAASQALAQGSTEQASSIQEITASINEIAVMTKTNAEDAGKANRIVIEAKQGALNGSEHMRDMMEAMSDINTASENISKIIKVIDDIAFQTNILALNAAVEAARAGQHGKGFAVVAEEVRNLAGKSAQAASETAELIEDSIRKVGKGSKIAEETAVALEKIVEAIDHIVNLTEASAKASNAQATATTQVDQALMQVSTVVQTNSSTSEQCAAASQELSAQAIRLLEMIGYYKLKGADDSNVGSGYYSAAAPARKPEAATSYIEEKPVPMISLDDGFGKY